MTKQLALINGGTARQHSSDRLDERTKKVGRIGLSQARAALHEANRRAAERDAARLALRDDELARRAADAQRLQTARLLDPGRPRRPGSRAA